MEVAWVAAGMEQPIMLIMLTPSIGLTNGEKIPRDLDKISKKKITTGVILWNFFGGKYTFTLYQVRSFHSNSTNIDKVLS